jgi:GTPase SAR1 family protein
MDLKNYLSAKELVKSNQLKLQIVLDDLKLNNVAKKIKDDMLALDYEKFTLVVVGEFSRGKSTFVNAMLGKKVLPSSKRPTTNIISKIVYADKPAYEIFLKDGKSKNLTEEEFKNIKAQAEEDPSNILKFKSFIKKEEDFSKIDYAIIGQPLAFCQNGVEVVDTPGTNDLNIGRMEITYNYLNRADAAVLLLNATQALTRSELDFLKERILGNQIKDIFVVINFKDELSPAEEIKVKNYVRDNIRDLAEIEPKIFLVSSSQALTYRAAKNGDKLTAREMMNLPQTFEETGFTEFEAALAKYLDEEKGKAKLNKYAERTLLYTKAAENDIQLRLQSLLHSADEIKAELAAMQGKVGKIKRETVIVMSGMEQRLSLSEAELKTYIDTAVKNMRLAALRAADGYKDGMNKKDIEYMLDKAVTPLQKELFDHVNTTLNKSVKEELTVALNKLKTVWDDLQLEQKNLLIENFSNMSLEITGNSLNSKGAADNTKFFYAAGAFLLAGLAGLGGVAVLGAIFGWLFGRDKAEQEQREKLKQQIREQYDNRYKNFSSNICQKYRESVKSVAGALQNEINNHLNGMEDQLKEIIKIKEANETDAEQQRNILNKQLDEVLKIKAAMAEVLKA